MEDSTGTTTRLELRDGQWADLSTRLTWGQYQSINAAILGLADDASRETVIEVSTVWAKAYTRAWNVRGPDGHELPLEDASWLVADAEVVEDITREAQRRWDEWRASRRPLASAPSSPASPEASPST